MSITGIPQQSKSQRVLLKAKIRPGCVLHVFCNSIEPPKYKFMVIVHIDYEDDLFLAFLINSRIPTLAQKNSDMVACQVMLESSEYPEFLRYNSYLNCAEVRDSLDVDAVLDHLSANPNNFRGELNKNEITKICQVVKDASTISGYDKELILKSLE